MKSPFIVSYGMPAAGDLHVGPCLEAASRSPYLSPLSRHICGGDLSP